MRRHVPLVQFLPAEWAPPLPAPATSTGNVTLADSCSWQKAQANKEEAEGQAKENADDFILKSLGTGKARQKGEYTAYAG